MKVIATESPRLSAPHSQGFVVTNGFFAHTSGRIPVKADGTIPA